MNKNHLKQNRNSAMKNSSNRKKLFRILILSLLILISYLSFDYIGPSKIPLKPDIAFDFECLRAKDLIVQEFDSNGDLWATRGMTVYKLEEDAEQFERVAHIPTGLNIFWIRNFTIVRRLTIRPECVEMTTTKQGDLCAVSAGQIWVKRFDKKKFVRSMTLEHYGFGDQGIRNDGIVSGEDGAIYFGEYFRNSNKVGVKIFKSKNKLTDWETAYEFDPGEIRHVHAIQNDPYSEKLWFCTGDYNSESMVGWSNDGFESIDIIGSGSQQWRVCQLVFTKEFVYWGTDNGTIDLSGIYCWNRATKEVEKLSEVDGAIFYGTQLTGGTIVMSTDREGMKNEKDDKTKLFIISDDHEISIFDCGTWHHNKPGFWFKFAKLRFQRNQGSPYLAISILNQKEFRDGDLVLIHEDSITSRVQSLNSPENNP